MKYPILRLPNWKKEFYIITDASDEGSGAVLAQEHGGYELPVAYYSKAWNPAEKSVHSYVKETRAVVRAIKYFQHYFWGRKFFLVTDCRALAHWNTVKEISAVVERYLSFIQTFDIEFVHRPGHLIPVADALSRTPKKGRINLPLSKEEPPHVSELPAIRNVLHLKLDASKVLEAQQESKLAKQIKMYLEIKEFPEEADKAEKVRIEEAAKGLELYHDIIVKREEVQGKNQIRIFVPSGKLRERVLYAMHDDPLAGHLGPKRTITRVKERFYWPTMDRDIKEYVQGCQSCKAAKPMVTKKVPLQPLPISGPWLDVHADYMVVKAVEKTHNILVMVDRYTRYVELDEANNITAAESARIFKDCVLYRHGFPMTVTTDGGSHFKAEFEELLKEYYIRHVVGLPDRHRSNGLAERAIRTIREYMRHYATKSDWTSWIPACRFAVNTATTSSHGTSPFRLVEGREPRIPIDNELAIPTETAKTKQMELAEETMGLYQKAMKERYDEKVSDRNLQLGDLVSIRNHSPDGKLDVRTYGPYRIEAFVENSPNVTLENPWVGKDSQFQMHQEDVIEYKGDAKVRHLTPMQEFVEPSKGAKNQLERLKMIKKHLGKEQLSYLDLIGKRVKVNWTQTTARGWWDGTVVDYEPRVGRHWIKYDIESQDGVYHFEEDLMGLRPPKWKFL
jgi:hypothetical protein